MKKTYKLYVTNNKVKKQLKTIIKDIELCRFIEYINEQLELGLDVQIYDNPRGEL